MPVEPSGGVVFVHAHPDDESMGTGGTIARLVAEGVRVDLVTCTDGAEGEIHDPTLDHDEARPRLAEIRAAELACSVAALGGGAIHHHMLGYRDSGMIGTDANAHSDCFWQADLDEATRRLVAIVRDARPMGIVSYDENGNYGHPDHINAARIARDAYRASAGETWEVARFYEIAWIRERWSELMRAMQERGIRLPWDLGATLDDVGDGAAPAPAEDDFGRADADVTTRVDVSAFTDAKRRSMDCHRTQRQDMGWLLDLPDDLARVALSTETYVLRWLDGADVSTSVRETWLLPLSGASHPLGSRFAPPHQPSTYDARAMSTRTINLTDDVVDYVHRHGVREHPVLAALRERTAPMPEHNMQIGPDQGAFMAMLVRLLGARRILEIGTFTGYSSTAMALALPDDGRITCCDVSREWTDIAQQAWLDAGVAHKVELRLAPATETLASLGDDSFDLAFIDADKPNYDAYYEGCLRVVRPGGLILIDNVLWSGDVADPSVDNDNVRAIRALNEKIAADERVDHVLLPLADGLTMARRRD